MRPRYRATALPRDRVTARPYHRTTPTAECGAHRAWESECEPLARGRHAVPSDNPCSRRDTRISRPRSRTNDQHRSEGVPDEKHPENHGPGAGTVHSVARSADGTGVCAGRAERSAEEEGRTGQEEGRARPEEGSEGPTATTERREGKGGATAAATSTSTSAAAPASASTAAQTAHAATATAASTPTPASAGV